MYNGVSKRPNGFIPRVRLPGGKKLDLPLCSTARQAALAYDKETRRLYGADAVTNFREDGTFDRTAAKTRQGFAKPTSQYTGECRRRHGPYLYARCAKDNLVPWDILPDRHAGRK